MTADERDELIFLYAGGALEGDERDEVEAWLASGDRQAFERLAAAEAELAELGHALPPVAASAAVKQRLLHRLEGAEAPSPPRQRDRLEHPASDREAITRSEPRHGVVASGARESSGQASEASAQPQAPEGRAQRGGAERSQILAPEGRAQQGGAERSRQLEAERSSSGFATAERRRGWFQHPALAAGLAALAAALVGAAVAQRAAERSAAARVDELRSELASVENSLGALRSELDRTAAERAQLDRDLADEEAARRSLESDLVMARKAISVLASEKAEAMALVGTAGRTARARVVWDWENWYCFLHVTGLAPDPNLIYALWLFTDTGEVVGLGPFGADASGEATLVSPVPHDLGHVVRAGISLEPDPDLSSKPRGEVVLLGETTKRS